MRLPNILGPTWNKDAVFPVRNPIHARKILSTLLDSRNTPSCASLSVTSMSPINVCHDRILYENNAHQYMYIDCSMRKRDITSLRTHLSTFFFCMKPSLGFGGEWFVDDVTSWLVAKQTYQMGRDIWVINKLVSQNILYHSYIIHCACSTTIRYLWSNTYVIQVCLVTINLVEFNRIAQSFRCKECVWNYRKQNAYFV